MVLTTEMVVEKLLTGFGAARVTSASVRLWDGAVTTGRSDGTFSTLHRTSIPVSTYCCSMTRRPTSDASARL